jgi:hypothetical protein
MEADFSSLTPIHPNPVIGFFTTIPKWLYSIIGIVLTLCAVLIWWLVQPTSPVNDLRLSNISDSQVTLSWTTDKPTLGKVVLSDTNTILKTNPFLGQKIIPETEGSNSNLRKKIHYVTLKGLKKTTKYYYSIYQSDKLIYQGTFSTTDLVDTISRPNPVYGQILGSDYKTPLSGAIVYLRLSRGKEASASSMLASTTTNFDGRWSIDLSSIRTFDGKDYFKVDKTIQEQLIVEAGELGSVKSVTYPGKDKPWPTIFVTNTSRQPIQIASPSAQIRDTATKSAERSKQ